ncbi:hypothetical protein pdam_00000088 [Pocillopora damicornis]|uniref:Uncharacterized protein n=1 Tax=Pocillopora damicornis TaxID=46731 RepID=A0A3M6UXB4_POCDA|nr:hypothetical protein pdam_00000088 [Pocillopora damicornis]
MPTEKVVNYLRAELDKPIKSSTENVGDNGEAGNLEMMKMNIRRRLEEAKREQQYRREICSRARELRCGMEQKK